MRRLDTREAGFSEQLAAVTAWQDELDQDVNRTVADVLADIASRGDAALLDYTARFDKLEAASVAELEVSSDRQAAALERIATDHRVALERAADRVRSYHEHQLQESWQFWY